MPLRPLQITAAFATAVAALTLASPAFAGSETIRDTKGDVAKPPARATASDAYLDIVRSTASYNARFTVSTSMRDLDFKKNFRAFWPYETDEQWGSMEIEQSDGVTTVVFVAFTMNGDKLDTKCIPDYEIASNTVTLWVPSRCVQNAESIRFGAGTGVPEDARRQRGDDVRTNGIYAGDDVTLGQPIEHG